VNKRQSIRFWNKVDKDGPVPEYRPELGRCWLWLGATSRGYGQVRLKGESHPAHRISYGKVPSGLTLDHLCRVRNCVNPSHLEPVTCRENILRGYSPCAKHAMKTRCSNGHEFSKENTLVLHGRHRQCRICNRKRDKEYRDRCRAGLVV